MYDKNYESPHHDYYHAKRKRHPLTERINHRYDDYETRFTELSLDNRHDTEARPSKYNGLRIPKFVDTMDFSEANSPIYDDFRNEEKVRSYEKMYYEKNNYRGQHENDGYSRNKHNRRQYEKDYEMPRFNKFNDYVNTGKHANRETHRPEYVDNKNYYDEQRHVKNRKEKHLHISPCNERRSKYKYDDDTSEEFGKRNLQISNHDHNRDFHDSDYKRKSHYKADADITAENNNKKSFRKEFTPREDTRMYDKLQRELDALKEKQKESLYYKENMVKIIEREVDKAKQEMELANEKEKQILLCKHKNEIRQKDLIIKENKKNHENLLERYKAACVKRIKLEKTENTKRLEAFRAYYEEKLSKYRNAYVKLKEKYKKDVFKKYADL